jgi:thioredoxin 1
MGKPAEVTDEKFKGDVIDSELPVLVDFWAGWCQPCQMIAPIIEELAEEYDGKIEFKKIDVDSNPLTPQTYGIRGIPALLIFQNGQVIDQIIGAQPKAALKDRIDSVLT